jgi:uncharacterized protein (DUF2141 family)
MKPTMTLALLLISLTLVQTTTAQTSSPTGNITVTITGIRNAKGQVLISLYDKAEGFPKDRDAVVQGKAVSPDTTAQVTVVFEDLPFGDYAVAVLHDEDSSSGMTFGKFRIPKEGYCFSNNVKVRFKSPKFKKASFVLDKDNVTQILRMRY